MESFLKLHLLISYDQNLAPDFNRWDFWLQFCHRCVSLSFWGWLWMYNLKFLGKNSSSVHKGGEKVMFYSALPYSSVSSLDKMYHSPDDKVQLSSINFELHGRFLKKSCNIFVRWMTSFYMKTHGKVTLVPKNVLNFYPI